jgi:hypothetical protein
VINDSEVTKVTKVTMVTMIYLTLLPPFFKKERLTDRLNNSKRPLPPLPLLPLLPEAAQ